MAGSSINPGSIANDVINKLRAAGDIVAGVNQVASGEGVTGLPEKSATAAANAIENPNPNAWNLVLGNTRGLLTRGLKILIGGVLIIAGLMRISGADKDILQIAKGAVIT